MCADLPFELAGLKFAGSAIIIGLAAGAARGAVDYAFTTGDHTFGGYLKSAARGAGEDSVILALPEESMFGEWAEGEHSAQVGFWGTLKELPSYMTSVLKSGLHALK